MRVVDGEMLPTAILDLAQREQKFVRIGIVARARFGIDILQRQNLERATFFAADDAARFIRRVAPRLGDELVQLFVGQFHFGFIVW